MHQKRAQTRRPIHQTRAQARQPIHKRAQTRQPIHQIRSATRQPIHQQHSQVRSLLPMLQEAMLRLTRPPVFSTLATLLLSTDLLFLQLALFEEQP